MVCAPGSWAGWIWFQGWGRRPFTDRPPDCLPHFQLFKKKKAVFYFLFSFKQKHLPTICPVHISLSILEQQSEISSCFHLNKALLDSSAPQKSAMIITVVLLSQMNLFHDEPPLQKQRGEYGRMAWGRRYRDDKTRTQAVSDGVKEVFILLDATMAVLYRKIFWLCQVHSNVLMGQMPQCFQFFQFPSAKKKKN